MSKGKDFEIAVYEFVKTLSPESKVYFDYKVSDRDTGTLRQVDVWIETTVANHIPVSILVSCKDYKRRLDIGHVGTFKEEVNSTGASTGVIYSRSGFTKPAIKKARASGLTCCQLYENAPADKPEALVFHYYACCPRVNFEVSFDQPLEGVSTHGDLYDLKIKKTEVTLIKYINDEFSLLEKEVKKDLNGFPKERVKKITVTVDNDTPLDVELTLGYRYYKGKLEAHLVSGSYCFTNGDFKGSQSGPVIDMKSVHPGPGWEEVSIDKEPPIWKAIAILSGGQLDPSQVEAMRSKALI